MQRQLDEDLNELNSKLTIKEKDIIKLKDLNKLLVKKTPESKGSVKQLKTMTVKVCTCIKFYMFIDTYRQYTI